MKPSEIISAASRFFTPEMKADTLRRTLPRWGLRTSLSTGPRCGSVPAPEAPPAPQNERSLFQEIMDGTPDLQVAVGRIHLKNDPPDFEAAKELFQAAANKGNSEAMYRMAMLILDECFQGNDPREAVSWLQQATRFKHRAAQFRLSLLKFTGSHLPQDRRGGQKLLIQAAEANYVDAQFELGERLLTGDGFRKNETKAKQWLMEAAYRGHEKAQFTLGNSKCGDISTVDSLAWLLIASPKHPQAAEVLQMALSEVEESDRYLARVRAAGLREAIAIVRERDPRS